MQRCYVRILLFSLLLCLCATVAADDWQLVIDDDFERAEPGPAWHMLGKYDARSLIVDGELVGDGNGLIMFAAMARRLGPRELEIRFVNFGSKDKQYGLAFVDMPAGNYTLSMKTVAGKELLVRPITISSRNHREQLILPVETELFVELKGAQ